MTSNFIRYDQSQQHLLPKDLSEWVEDDSLERFVSDTIDYLNEQDRLEPFYPVETDENRGRPQFHPVMMLKVLVFAKDWAAAEWSLFSATHNLLKMWRKRWESAG